MTGARFLIPLVTGVVLFLGTPFVGANSIGPLVAHTGAPAVAGLPAEPTCAKGGCHNAQVNNGQGTIELIGLPDAYVPGETYALTVRLSSTSNQANTGRRWGFELTAYLESDGKGTRAGTFTTPDATQINVANGRGTTDRTYVRHLIGGVRQGEASPVEWTFSWTAPASGEGTVLFAFAGNATNGNGSSTGDFVYTGTAFATEAETPVEATTWGSLKAGARLRD